MKVSNNFAAFHPSPPWSPSPPEGRGGISFIVPVGSSSQTPGHPRFVFPERSVHDRSEMPPARFLAETHTFTLGMILGTRQ